MLRTEIQTERRNLTTFPNLYLVTNPVRVMRSSGTVISVEVSLGYDVSRHLVEKLLLEAAEEGLAALAEELAGALACARFDTSIEIDEGPASGRIAM